MPKQLWIGLISCALTLAAAIRTSHDPHELRRIWRGPCWGDEGIGATNGRDVISIEHVRQLTGAQGLAPCFDTAEPQDSRTDRFIVYVKPAQCSQVEEAVTTPPSETGLGQARDDFGDPVTGRFKMQETMDGSESLIVFPAGVASERFYVNYFDRDGTYVLQREERDRKVKIKTDWEIPLRFIGFSSDAKNARNPSPGTLLTLLRQQGLMPRGKLPGAVSKRLSTREGLAIYSVGSLMADCLIYWFEQPHGIRSEDWSICRSEVRRREEELPGIGAPYPVTIEELSFLAKS